MSLHENLLDGPPPTYLPEDTDALVELTGGADAYDVVRRYPSSSLAWAVLADAAWNEGRVMESFLPGKGSEKGGKPESGAWKTGESRSHRRKSYVENSWNHKI